ncbi:MAG: D-tyrosyl-tRNA(Tyr) deacylase [Ruminococcaceae bacterium]|nr:D-tyrosyl-tRNA(Tyr) deacylase [Oscillospiraceae bacterium]
MIAVIQRAASASVIADGVQAGKCEKGLFVLLGVVDGDTEKDAEILAAKVSKLRIFTDENDKMNLSVKDVSGSVLVVSNFTLGADVSHGNRPSFTPAAHPTVAEPLYEYFASCVEKEGVPTEKGVFGADMQISLHADGPVTILMDSKIWNK